MARLHLSKSRAVETMNTNLGKIILFCEGTTEKFYFDYFANIINRNGNKYNNVVIATESANGNAARVVDYSVEYMKTEENNRLYGNYGKYLVFDCDAPKNIANVIAQSINNTYDFKLLVSNHFFETWLLMHFENVETKLSKKKVYADLSQHLVGKYRKSNRGIIREVIYNGSIEKAIENAKKLENKYRELGKNIYDNIDEMNPYTNVYLLVEQLMLIITY